MSAGRALSVCGACTIGFIIDGVLSCCDAAWASYGAPYTCAFISSNDKMLRSGCNCPGAIEAEVEEFEAEVAAAAAATEAVEAAEATEAAEAAAATEAAEAAAATEATEAAEAAAATEEAEETTQHEADTLPAATEKTARTMEVKPKPKPEPEANPKPKPNPSPSPTPEPNPDHNPNPNPNPNQGGGACPELLCIRQAIAARGEEVNH